MIDWRQWIPRRWWRSERLRRHLEAMRGRGVLGGPFAGMRSAEASYGSELLPKWLGTYELELREALEQALARSPERVVVLGAAEGYYAVGLALRVPTAAVVAFEAREDARAAVLAMAMLNGVASRIAVRGICEVEAVRAACGSGERLLVVCDLDGAEAVLLDPGILPALGSAELIVETHDCFVPGTVALLRQRFEGTHHVTELRQRVRVLADAPALALPRSFAGALVQAMNERRPEANHWLHLLPR